MPDAEGQDRYTAPRKAMVDTIVALTRETAAETGRARLDGRVLRAMNKVPRHHFVPADQEPNAYANRPLPIGNGQTISQPFIVALMTDMLGLKATDRVLEIGTGCGYQAAVLAELAREVYTIEIVAPLARKRPRGSRSSATAISTCAAATATAAGRSTRRSTRSS